MPFIKWGNYRSQDEKIPDKLELETIDTKTFETEYSVNVTVKQKINDNWEERILPLKSHDSNNHILQNRVLIILVISQQVISDRISQLNKFFFHPQNRDKKVRSIKLLVGLSFVACFAIFSVLYLTYEPESEILQEIKLQPTALEYELTRTETTINEDGTVSKTIETIKDLMEIHVTFEDSEIVANKPTPVKVNFFYPDYLPDAAWEKTVDVHILSFPGSENIVESYDPVAGGIIKMKKSPTSKLYYGNGELVFPTPGEYGYRILFPSDAYSVEYENNDDGTIDMSIKALSINAKVYPDSIFTVNPISSLAELENIVGNKYLTMFFVGAALIGIRGSVTKGVIWVADKK